MLSQLAEMNSVAGKYVYVLTEYSRLCQRGVWDYLIML